MPFRSRQQAKWMFATHPQMAKQWAAETPSFKDLPTKVGTSEKPVSPWAKMNAAQNRNRTKF